MCFGGRFGARPRRRAMKQAARAARFPRIPVNRRRFSMRKTFILLAAGTAAIATPAFAQLAGTAGQVTGHVTGDVAGQVDPAGTVGNVIDQVTQPVGEVVDQVDQTANDAVDATDLTLATQEQVRAGANVTDMDGNSIGTRSEEHTSELQSLMRIPYALFCLNKKITHHNYHCNLRQPYETIIPTSSIILSTIHKYFRSSGSQQYHHNNIPNSTITPNPNTTHL